MSLDNLIRKLQSDSDTSDTSATLRDVSRKAAPMLACTPDTPDTSQIINSQIKKNRDWVNAEKINSITPSQEAILKTWLTEIGESESEHYLVLNKCRKDCEARNYFLKLAAEHAREKRRQKVIKMLTDNPDIQRAFITDAESNKDNVILTMVIRDKYSFEMLIPKTKYDAFAILAAIQNLGTQ